MFYVLFLIGPRSISEEMSATVTLHLACVKASSSPVDGLRIKEGVRYITQPPLPPIKTRVANVTPGRTGTGGEGDGLSGQGGGGVAVEQLATMAASALLREHICAGLGLGIHV